MVVCTFFFFQILLEKPVYLTGITVSSLPGALKRKQSGVLINIFARDLHLPEAARFTCVYEGVQQPEFGRKTVQLQPVVTDHVVLRGNYQTVPIVLHGMILDDSVRENARQAMTAAESRGGFAYDAGKVITVEQALADPYWPEAPCAPLPSPIIKGEIRFVEDNISKIPENNDGTVVTENHSKDFEEPWDPHFSVSFEKDCLPWFRKLLQIWERVEDMPQKMIENPLSNELQRNVREMADNICNAFLNTASLQYVNLLSIPESDFSMIVDMVMAWTGMLADIQYSGTRSDILVDYGTLGIASCVLLLVNEESSKSFLSRSGHVLLADILSRKAQLPLSIMQYAITSCLLLLKSCSDTAFLHLIGSQGTNKSIVWKSTMSVDQSTRTYLHEESFNVSPSYDTKIPQIDGTYDDDIKRRNMRKDRDGRHNSRRDRDKDRDERDRESRRSRSRREEVHHKDQTRKENTVSEKYKKDYHREDYSRRKKSRSHSRSRSRRREQPSRDRDSLHRREQTSQEHNERGKRQRLFTEISSIERKVRGNDEGQNIEYHDSREDTQKRARQRKQTRSESRSESPSYISQEKSFPRRHVSRQPIQEDTKCRIKEHLPVSREDVEYKREMEMYWNSSSSQYRGVYNAIASLLADSIQPGYISHAGKKTLRLLRFYNSTNEFCITVKNMASLFGKTNQNVQGIGAFDLQYITDMAPRISATLSLLAIDILNIEKKCKTSHGRAYSVKSLKNSFSGQHQRKCKLEHELASILEKRRILAMLAIALRLPAAILAVSQSFKDHEKQIFHLSKLLQTNLREGVSKFLASLAATSSGISLLKRCPSQELKQLVVALDSAGSNFKYISSAFSTVITSHTAISKLVVAPLISSDAAQGAWTLLTYLRDANRSRRFITINAIILKSQELMPVLLRALKLQCNVLSYGSTVDSGLLNVKVDKFLEITEAFSYLNIGIEAVLGMVDAMGNSSIPVFSSALASRLVEDLTALSSLLCNSLMPGASKLFAKMERVRGSCDSVNSLCCNGISGLIDILQNCFPSENTTMESVTHELAAHCEEKSQNATEIADQHGQESSECPMDAIGRTSEKDAHPELDVPSWEYVKAFWDDPFRRGRALSSLRMIANALQIDRDMQEKKVVLALHSMNALKVLARVLNTANKVFEGSQADRQWMFRTGAAIDSASSAENRLGAEEFMVVITEVLALYLEGIQGITTIKDRFCIAALVKAHEVLSADDASLIVVLGKSNQIIESSSGSTDEGNMKKKSLQEMTYTTMKPCHQVVLSRRYVAFAIRCWIEMRDWKPQPLSVALLGFNFVVEHTFSRDPWCGTENINMLRSTPNQGDVASGLEASPSFSLPPVSPKQLLAAISIVGDLCPDEWPPPGRRARGRSASNEKAVMPPPTDRKWRLSLAHSFEGCKKVFAHLIEMSISSESAIVRALTVRVLTRCSGLGGGMAPFLVSPIVSVLEQVSNSLTVAHDARLILELLVPLVYRPAIKAAILETQALLHLDKILSIIVTGASSNPPSVEEKDAFSIVTMILELLTAMYNAEIALDPSTTPEFDVPTASKGAAIAATLLQHIENLGPNLQLSHRVLRLMTSTAAGRGALRLAAINLHFKSTGQEIPSTEEKKRILSAAQWVAKKFWQASSQAKKQGNPFSVIGADIADIMKEICASMETDSELVATPPTAAVRFAAAAQAAVAAVQNLKDSMPCEDQYNSDPIVMLDLAIKDIFDQSVKMFWRNRDARSVQKTRAAAITALKRYTKYECGHDEDLTVSSMLQPYITIPSRPLIETMHADLERDVYFSETELANIQREETKTDEGKIIDSTSPQYAKDELLEERPGHVTHDTTMMVANLEDEMPKVTPLESEMIPVVETNGEEKVSPLDIDIYADLTGLEAVSEADRTVLTSAGQVEADTISETVTKLDTARTEDTSNKYEEDKIKYSSDQKKIDVAGNLETDWTTAEKHDAIATDGDGDEPLARTESSPKEAEDHRTPIEKIHPEIKPESRSELSAAGPESKPDSLEEHTEADASIDIEKLLSDPSKLAEVLKKNPALRSILKQKLSQKKG